MRKLSPQPGMTGRLHYIVQGIAGGEVTDWPEGTKITVVSCEGQNVTARDDKNRETIIAHWNVDVGSEYEIDGIWYPESHPWALDHLERELRELRAQKPHGSSAINDDRQTAIRDIEAKLRRYRRDSRHFKT